MRLLLFSLTDMWTALTSFAMLGLVAINFFAYTKAIEDMYAEASGSNPRG